MKFMSNITETQQGTGLINIENMTRALGLGKEYVGMMSLIKESEREISVATAQHGKTHSQFQYALLDCAGPIAGLTKLRNWRQILAVIERTRDALEDASLKLRENEVKLNILDQRLDAARSAGDMEKAALLQIKIQTLECHAARSTRAIAGAVRKLATYVKHFKELEAQIRKELNKPDNEPITEEDFEKDEERFHIIKAFQQGLQAARAHGGRIDHGNMIYFDDIGISGHLAQKDVFAFLKAEEEFAKINPNAIHELHALEREFLYSMAKKYAGCSSHLLEAKGLVRGIIPEVTLRLTNNGDK
jgi:hypothetical protein